MDFYTFFQIFISELLKLIKGPTIVTEVWWTIIPLIVVTLIMILYFGKYKDEQMGWNTALGNSIVLIFVGLDLLRLVYNYSSPAAFNNFIFHPIKLAIILIIMFEGLVLSYTSFQHNLPKKLVFFIASPLAVNTQAYILTIIVYLRYTPNWITLLAAITLFFVIFIILKLIQELEHLILGYHSKN